MYIALYITLALLFFSVYCLAVAYIKKFKEDFGDL